MSAALLDIRNLTIDAKAEGGVRRNILSDASVAVEPGEVVALIGESGAGKSTLALAALGYARVGTRITAGSIRFADTDVLSLSRDAKQSFRGRDVAYVAQSAAAALNPGIRIGEQIGEGLLLHGRIGGARPSTRVIDLLRLLQFSAPHAIARRFPSQLSGGQQQRAMMAMAMACEPRLLVLDEPTTALDVTTQIEVLKAIRDVIRDHNTAALYVSHDLAVVAQVATRIVVMRHGEIIEQGSARSILEDPRQEYTRALLKASRRLDGPIPERSEGKPAAPLLRVEAVSASYRRGVFALSGRSERVLHGVSLEVTSGETLALVGESGSGKSTLIRVIAGLHRPADGAVRLDERDLPVTARRRAKRDLRRIQIVFQSPEQALNPRMTVGGTLDQVLRFYSDMPADQRRKRTEELLDMVGLQSALAAKFPRELSGGQRQRVAIARAFAAKPDIVMCDEILSALDSLVATQIVGLMAKLKREHGVAYVFVSHDLATVAAIADRVAVMHRGRIVETGPTAGVFAAARHPYTRLLLQSVPQLRQNWLDDVIAGQSMTQTREASEDGGGCGFVARCPVAIDGLCERVPPPSRKLADGHMMLCHRESDDSLRTTH